jgi:hypothetical protein
MTLHEFLKSPQIQAAKFNRNEQLRISFCRPRQKIPEHETALACVDNNAWFARVVKDYNPRLGRLNVKIQGPAQDEHVDDCVLGSLYNSSSTETPRYVLQINAGGNAGGSAFDTLIDNDTDVIYFYIYFKGTSEINEEVETASIQRQALDADKDYEPPALIQRSWDEDFQLSPNAPARKRTDRVVQDLSGCKPSDSRSTSIKASQTPPQNFSLVLKLLSRAQVQMACGILPRNFERLEQELSPRSDPSREVSNILDEMLELVKKNRTIVEALSQDDL